MLGMKLPCTWPVSSSTRTPTTTRETYQTHLVADCLGCRIVGLASATTIGAQDDAAAELCPLSGARDDDLYDRHEGALSRRRSHSAVRVED